MTTTIKHPLAVRVRRLQRPELEEVLQFSLRCIQQESGVDELDTRTQLYRKLESYFLPKLDGYVSAGVILGAFSERELIGFCAYQPTSKPRRALPIWPQRQWWHLGNGWVDSCWRRRGVASAMLAEFCADMDTWGAFS